MPHTVLEVYGFVRNRNMGLKLWQKHLHGMTTAANECFILFMGREFEGPKSFPGRAYIMTQYIHAYTCVCSVSLCLSLYVFTGLWYKMSVYMKQNRTYWSVYLALANIF